MARIAYILLCHKDPDAVLRQAGELTAAGDYVAIHFDANGVPEDYRRLIAALAGNANVVFTKKRVKCGWGEWSLVQATLNTIRTALKAWPEASHLYMLSGDCMPIKTAQYVHRFLDDNDNDFIEAFDFFNSNWIKTGLKQERLIYRHYFNERTSKAAFYRSLELQQKLGLTRKLPPDIDFRIGSQWWCLRRQTVEAVIATLRKRRDITRLFSTTWIPDETFFQTMVAHVVPQEELCSRTLTFLMFSDYGMPVTFYNDHYDLLLAQNYLFARKISPEADDLKRRLGGLYTLQDVSFQIADTGRQQYNFLAGRGRIGQRFARRFWEETETERDLLIVICKRHDVANRLMDRIKDSTGLAAVGYVFNDPNAPLPDLGGIETTLEKRTRHRRSLVGLLFDRLDTDRLIMCMDPGNIGQVEDFVSGKTRTRLLEVGCAYSDQDLRDHAIRVGLAQENTPAAGIDNLLPALRTALEHENAQLRDMKVPHHYRVSDTATPEENAKALGEFLQVPESLASGIVNGNTFLTD